MNRLLVKSPTPGIVAMFRLREQLLHRPVQRGERLLQVADPSGDWQLELDIKEQQVGHILRAQERSGEPTLPVKYVLSTAVEKTFHGRLTKVATRTGESEKLGSVVEVIAELDASEIPERHIGAEVHAKIYCGQRSLGYVLFGDVIEFLARHVFF